MNKIKNDKIFKHHCSQQDSMHSNCRQDSPFPQTSKQNVYLYSYFKHKYKHLTLTCNNWNKYILNI